MNNFSNLLLINNRDERVNFLSDSTNDIINKMHAAGSAPGVLGEIFGEEYYLYGVHKEDTLNGCRPGEIIAQRDGAICIATIDGALWVSHLKKNKLKPPQVAKMFKLPATMLLQHKVANIPESPSNFFCQTYGNTFEEIWYEEKNNVGYLNFDFHNGAMSADQCNRLKKAYTYIATRQTRVIVLMGGKDFWSNGIHLNIIEAASNPAEESWRNINAINDLILEIINTTSKLTVSALWGSAGAGGAIMSLAADHVWGHAGCVLNPNYKAMGLYGSEYWTYLLPRRVGHSMAIEIMESTQPVGIDKAKMIGFVDKVMSDEYSNFLADVKISSEELANNANYKNLLSLKIKTRNFDETVKPLCTYREEELKKMHAQFYDENSSYNLLRHRFVYKIKPS